MPLLDFAGYASPVEGLGPGQRLVIWVRGCERRCDGCLTPDLWEHGDGIPVEQVAEELAPVLSLVDGVSISGGEPFDQADALVALIDALRAHADVEVLIYTGYELDEVRKRGDTCVSLLTRTDILIDGPFVESLPNTLQWRGSDNQQVHLLSARAQRYRDIADLAMPAKRPLQVQQLGPGRFRLIGIPRRGDLAAYRAAMATRGLEVTRE